MKIVLDTNVLISGILWKGPPNDILKHIEMSEKIELVQCTETFNEFKEVIKRGKFAEIIVKRQLEISHILASIITLSKFYLISEQVRDKIRNEVNINDTDDLKFISLAVEANAKYVVSGDYHLLNLDRYNNIKIVDSAEFLKIISA